MFNDFLSQLHTAIHYIYDYNIGMAESLVLDTIGILLTLYHSNTALTLVITVLGWWEFHVLCVIRNHEKLRIFNVVIT